MSFSSLILVFLAIIFILVFLGRKDESIDDEETDELFEEWILLDDLEEPDEEDEME